MRLSAIFVIFGFLQFAAGEFLARNTAKRQTSGYDFGTGLQWSSNGPIDGKHCVQWGQHTDQDTSNDNFLCFNEDYGARWSSGGPIFNMDCTQILGTAWNENYMCVPKNNPWRFLWNSAGPIQDRFCVQANNPNTWDDNYICLDENPNYEPAPSGGSGMGPVPTRDEFGIGLQWSYGGPIRGKHCIQFSEPSDPHTWNDNYLCFNKDYGVRWSNAGNLPTMECTQIIEPSDPYSWTDNFVCVPTSSVWRFKWSYSGPIQGKHCVLTNEPGDPHGWDNNYICVEGNPNRNLLVPRPDEVTANKLGLQWSFAGPIQGKRCVQLTEPSDPHSWTDNYLCFNDDYGVRWSYSGPINGMDCTLVNEPSDPHSWHDNYICLPAGTPWKFRWSNSGLLPGKSCVQTSEPSDFNSWSNNFICVEGKMGRAPSLNRASVQSLGMQWSSGGSIFGKHCVQMREFSDPHSWNDNFICFNRDFGVRWNAAGPIKGMACTQIVERTDPHSWHDNYLCVPNNSKWRFLWSSAGPIGGKSCVQLLEKSDPNSWSDNYLCVDGNL